MSSRFRPVGINLAPRAPVVTPRLIPRAVQPVLAHALRALVVLAALTVIGVAILFAFVLHPVVTVAWLAGWFVIGKIVRVIWRATR